nr:MAG TPA: hypothetical protein [Caudoviricetes sp.]
MIVASLAYWILPVFFKQVKRLSPIVSIIILTGITFISVLMIFVY